MMRGTKVVVAMVVLGGGQVAWGEQIDRGVDMSGLGVGVDGGEVNNGYVTPMGMGFHYQGELMFEGAPANGEFYFEVRFVDESGALVGTETAEVGPVMVTDGLFEMEILMGGDEERADRHWRQHGTESRLMRVSVSDVEGGPFTTLSPDVDVSATPRALTSRYADRIRLPYSDSSASYQLNSTTVPLFQLEDLTGGTLFSGVLSGESPSRDAVSIQEITDKNTYDERFLAGVRVDTPNRFWGIWSRGDGTGVYGETTGYPFSSPYQPAGVLGVVSKNAQSHRSVGVLAVNESSGKEARLATEDYAGHFIGDVFIVGSLLWNDRMNIAADIDATQNLFVEGSIEVDEDLRVEREVLKEYNGVAKQISPVAFGKVALNGTIRSGSGNFNVTWEASEGRFRIDVPNIYLTTDYTTIVTVNTTGAVFASSTTASGDMVVYFYTPDVNPIQRSFSFVIYDRN